MAVSRIGLFGHFPPWNNQGAESKGSSRSSLPLNLLRKPGNYSYRKGIEKDRVQAKIVQGRWAISLSV
jgi:hypothetical protein